MCRRKHMRLIKRIICKITTNIPPRANGMANKILFDPLSFYYSDICLDILEVINMCFYMIMCCEFTFESK